MNVVYEVEWIAKDNTSGVYLVEDDEREFISFIKYCLKNGHEITATARKENK